MNRIDLQAFQMFQPLEQRSKSGLRQKNNRQYFHSLHNTSQFAYKHQLGSIRIYPLIGLFKL